MSFYPYIDISTTVIPKTSVKRGDYNIAETETTVFNKTIGVGTAIRRGYACAQNNAVTPNVYAVTSGKATGLITISGLPIKANPHYANVTGATDGTGEDISSDDLANSFQGILDGKVVVKATGTLQPGDQVMTAVNGTFTKYDGSGPQYIKGSYLGLPGGTSDASYIKQGCNDGDLVVIDFDGGS